MMKQMMMHIDEISKAQLAARAEASQQKGTA